MIVCGIDTGLNTGIAAWDTKGHQLLIVETMKIHKAMDYVRAINKAPPAYDVAEKDELLVLFEDARLRKWFGGADDRQKRSGAGIREGVGSVKRDASIWEHFLTDIGVPFIARKPVIGGTKWTAKQFKQLTKWEGQTNEHSRDAAMMVFGLNQPQIDGMLRAAKLPAMQQPDFLGTRPQLS